MTARWLLTSLLLALASPAAAETAFVTTGQALVKLDLAAGTVAATGSDVRPALLGALAASRNGQRIEVASQEIDRRDRVREYDATTLRQTAAVGVGARIGTVAMSPDGRTLYAVSNHLLSVADMAAHRVVRVLPEGVDDAAAALTPDGRLLFVAGSGQTLLAFDTTRGKIVARRHLGHALGGLAMAPNGQRLYIADRDGPALLVVDVGTVEAAGAITVDRGPVAVALSPDGRTAYVACSGYAFTDTEAERAKVAGLVDVVDLQAGRVVRRIAVGGDPFGIASTAGGKLLVADGRSSVVSVLDPGTGMVTGRIIVPGPAITALAVVP